MLSLHGIIPALVTPSDGSGAVNLRPVPKLIDFMLSRRVDGFFIGGTTGEGFRLTTEERKGLAEIAVEHVARRVPVVIHVGSMNSREAAALARHAAQIGADAVSSVLPFYYAYDLPEIRGYYQSIADSCGLPIIIYCLTGAGDTSFGAERFLDVMSSVDGLYGIKFSENDLFKMQCLAQLGDGRVHLYGGVDMLALAMLAMGAKGLIGSGYNAVPEPWVELRDAFSRGDMTRAIELQGRITYYMRRFGATQPIARAKYLLRLRGIDVGQPWPPHAPLSAEQEKLLAEILAEMKADPLLKMRD
ncbi:MAG: dihydrodipicolinate synthase family protein [Pirellulales bacterium]